MLLTEFSWLGFSSNLTYTDSYNVGYLRRKLMQIYSIAEAKDQLPRILRNLNQFGEVQLTRYGKPIAVLLSAQQYRLLQQRQALDFNDVLRTLRKNIANTSELDDTQVFETNRHEQHDRDFAF